MRCTTCNSGEVTEIGFASNNGTTYRFCRVCENGTWEAAGESLATPVVLSLVKTIEPGRRRAAA